MRDTKFMGFLGVLSQINSAVMWLVDVSDVPPAWFAG